ncbi:MAG: hypothetical protein ACR2HQ_15075 [Ilumatobacteraceae bacterium]
MRTTSASAPSATLPRQIDVVVSATGGGALVDSVQVAGLTLLEPVTIGQPLAQFELVLDSCCEEQNRVVFTSGSDGFDAVAGEPPALQVSGPACSGAVSCTGDDRIVALSPSGPTRVSFELSPLVDVAELIEVGSWRVELTPTFDYASRARDDEVMEIELRIDVDERRPAPSGDTTPVQTATSPVTVVGGGFELLSFPFAGIADDIAQLDALLATSLEPVDTAALGIDWATGAAMVLTIPTNACPPLLTGLEVSDRRAEPTFVRAGYTACIDPLLSHTVIATVERALIAEVDELVLPADPSYFETAVVVPVDAMPGLPPTGPAASPPNSEFGEVTGTVALPQRGEVGVGRLDDGTPLHVVHHHDGTVSALDPRAPNPYPEPKDTHVLVAWESSTRTFLSNGAWDEFGRRVDGFRSTDLKGFATRVSGDVVQIGAPVAAPLGSPIASTVDPPAMGDEEIPLTDPISLEQAFALPVGSTALIDASVIVDPGGAFVCVVAEPNANVGPCPPGSPIAEGITPEPGYRSGLFGPLLATRTERGFATIVATGGFGGTAL